ncbi:PIG-L family deacetylase [Streptomyces sp. NPDC126497]|uniref:PIG-L family deacetylase n=1 Tax=Streptomyces sp. NPDC126497 TaxID=3155313 RepID=UPI00331B496E
MSAQREARAQLVVSPHPDDAVWSLGGRLAHWVAQGVPVTVVTIFDGPEPEAGPAVAPATGSAPASGSVSEEAAPDAAGARRSAAPGAGRHAAHPVRLPAPEADSPAPGPTDTYRTRRQAHSLPHRRAAAADDPDPRGTAVPGALDAHGAERDAARAVPYHPAADALAPPGARRHDAHPLLRRRLPSPGTPSPDDPDAWRYVARPAVRRREDRAALGELGVEHVSLGFTDAALRTTDGRYRYRSAPRVFAARHPDDDDLPGAIRDALRPLCPPGTRVHAPLAAGRHVDHVVSRAAVERLAVPGTAWYEDFPYPLRRRDHHGFVARCQSLTDAEVERWLVAALHYASQAEALFGGPDGLRRALLARARAHGAEAGTPHADRHWLGAEPDGP